jgi:hypothetical protein
VAGNLRSENGCAISSLDDASYLVRSGPEDRPKRLSYNSLSVPLALGPGLDPLERKLDNR